MKEKASELFDMKDKEELEYQVRAILDRISKTGSYYEDDLKNLVCLYWQGQDDLRNELRYLLGIKDES